MGRGCLVPGERREGQRESIIMVGNCKISIFDLVNGWAFGSPFKVRDTQNQLRVVYISLRASLL